MLTRDLENFLSDKAPSPARVWVLSLDKISNFVTQLHYHDDLLLYSTVEGLNIGSTVGYSSL